MSGQARIWAHYQNRDPESFSWGRTRLAFLLGRALATRPVGDAAAERPLRVLTVGAGDGFLERGLARAGHEVTSLDLDAETVARLSAEGIRAVQGELHRFDGAGGPFDLAVASEVLEHVPTEDLVPSVARVHAALRPGGRFLVTVPFREDLARGTTVCPHCGAAHHLWGHVQSFDEARLVQILGAGGFERVEVAPRFFANYRQLNWGGRLAFLLKHAAWLLARRPSSSLKLYAEATRSDAS